MTTKSFWPLDYDPEGAIYESPSWDLPGFRHYAKDVRRSKSRNARQAAKQRNS